MCVLRGAEHFERLQGYLKGLKLPFEIEHRLVRGLDYYTRTVFEIQPDTEGAQSTLGGGGRYDDLIEELGGQPMASVGFATGLERIILNMEKQGITAPVADKPLVFIAHQGEAASKQVFNLASALRRNDTAIIQATGSKSLKAQLRQANNIKAAYAVIIGEDEVRNGTVVLRNMATSEQRTMPLHKLAGELKTTLG